MNYRWWIVSSLLCVCLLSAAMLFWKEAPKQDVALSDGSLVRFEKVGRGKISYDSYSPLKAMIANNTPSRFRDRFGERIQGSFTVGDKSLGLMFSWWGSDGSRKQQGTQFLSRVEFTESTGFVFAKNISGYSASGNMILFSDFSFPRRDPMLNMRCYEAETNRLLFDLKIPNPFFPVQLAEWKPEALPATRTNDPLTVTLKHRPAEFQENYPRAEDFEITSTDPRWMDMTPQHYLWLTDATGNRGSMLSDLSPFEPAWKITLMVRRNPLAEFDPDEVWRTERFAVPDELSVEKLNLKKTLAGVELGIKAISSSGALKDDGKALTVSFAEHQGRGVGYSWGTSSAGTIKTIESGLPFIILTHSQLEAESELNIVIRDQNGTKISIDSGTTHGMNGESMRIIQFEPKPESKEIELEIKVNRGRTFEFLVGPPNPTATDRSR